MSYAFWLENNQFLNAETLLDDFNISLAIQSFFSVADMSLVQGCECPNSNTVSKCHPAEW